MAAGNPLPTNALQKDPGSTETTGSASGTTIGKPPRNDFRSTGFGSTINLAQKRIRAGFPDIPGIFFRSPDGSRSGYFHDLITILATRLGYRIEWVDASWNDCLAGLAAGDIDLLGFASPTLATRHLFTFGRETVISTWGTVLVKPGLNYKDIGSLHGARIAMVRGLQETAEILAFAKAADILLVPVYKETADRQLEAFRTGEVEAIVIPSHVAIQVLKKGNSSATGIVLSPGSHGFAIRQDAGDELLSVLDSLDLELRDIKDYEPAILKSLSESYLEPPRQYSIPPWLVALIAILSAAGILSLVFVLLLQYQVRRQTVTLTAQRDQLVAAAQREQEINKELEAFSYSVSHDLRAPLRAINGFTSILRERYSEKLGLEGTALADKVLRSAGTMEKLVQSLLELAHVGKTELHIRAIDMNSILDSVLEEIQTDEQKALFIVEKTGIPAAAGDETLLRQVWANLLANAFKYSMKSAVKKIAIRGEQGPAECQYHIRDWGAGFDPSQSGKLFGVFQRLHSASEFAGTGVGLATVKRIISRHGGRVWAEGKPGEGATFHFSIPVAKSSPPPKAP